MTLPCYLAMTAAEFAAAKQVPKKIGWMACRFSVSDKGVSNLPTLLPPGALLILNDETPICGHDPERILETLAGIVRKFDCCGVFLDFQRPDSEETAALCRFLTGKLPCPVGVTELYAANLSCPVCIAPPLRKPLADTIAPWKGREIWLEAILEAEEATVTEQGATIRPCPIFSLQEPASHDKRLFCHYHLQKTEDKAVITVVRTAEDLWEFLEHAAGLGITKTVGLYQQLRNIPAFL